jgi:hypothetical protein
MKTLGSHCAIWAASLPTYATALVSTIIMTIAPPTGAGAGTTMQQQPESTHCLGRFRFAADTSWRPSGRYQNIFRVAVSSAPTEVPWVEREHVALHPPAVALKRFELEPGAPALWYRADPAKPRFVSLMAQKTVGSSTVVLQRELGAGAEEPTEGLYRALLAAYVPGSMRGFCIGEGSLDTEPSTTETARLSLTQPEPQGLELSIETQTTAQPETDDLLAQAAARTAELVRQGMQAELRVNRARQVGGLEGVESRVWIRDKAQPQLLYMWRFAGRANDAFAPQIHLQGEAPEAQKAVFDAAWERLLQSWRAVEPPPARR